MTRGSEICDCKRVTSEASQLPDTMRVPAPQTFPARTSFEKITQLGLVNAGSDAQTFIAMSNSIPPRIQNTTWSSSGACFSSRGPWAYLQLAYPHNFDLRSRSAATLFSDATSIPRCTEGLTSYVFMRSSFEVRPSSSAFPEAESEYTVATDTVRTPFVDHPVQRPLQEPDRS